jgi:hypothetical protein
VFLGIILYRLATWKWFSNFMQENCQLNYTGNKLLNNDCKSEKKVANLNRIHSEVVA